MKSLVIGLLLSFSVTAGAANLPLSNEHCERTAAKAAVRTFESGFVGFHAKTEKSGNYYKYFVELKNGVRSEVTVERLALPDAMRYICLVHAAERN
jgi:hypothetical protein